jgi:hypothetical protein
LSSTRTQPTESSSDLKNYLRPSSPIAIPKIPLDLTVANVERQQQRRRKEEQQQMEKKTTPLENREYLKKFPSLASVGCEERDSILGFAEELEE